VSVRPGLLRRLYKMPRQYLPGEYHPSVVLRDRPGMWNGVADSIRQRQIQRDRIVRITVNHGGSSVSLRLHFADGASAAFKPEQSYIQSVPRKEIAAYLVNRLLGLSRVPPATYRVITVHELFSKLESARWQRRWIRKSIRADGHGRLAGEVSWWIPKIAHIPLEKWTFRKRWHQWIKAYKRLPRRHYRMSAQISVLLVFDFLINNMDRLSGWNVCGTPDWGRLYFMDNTMSFFAQPKGTKTARTGLERVQRFSRRLFRNLKKMSESRLRAELSAYVDAPWPLLTDREIEMLMARRDYVLRYMHQMIARYGWHRTMVYP